ncbi:Six-hairpin glycosidase-like protein [Aspergillus carlsbadensis]|nr:Six-hairpin glycosidase-like protein [Aspergillus carlsbadensis]
MSSEFDQTWMWHPHFREDNPNTSGLFVHFRRRFEIQGQPPKELAILITADTKYKLYVNNEQVALGPVKGDAKLWFYDQIDIGPYLREGENHIAIHVLRLFYRADYAPSFPRLPTGGAWVVPRARDEPWSSLLRSSEKWETAIDPYATLRVDEPEDHFLHIYERTSATPTENISWYPAKLLAFKNRTGYSPPWHLAPRMIPEPRVRQVTLSRVHNVRSDVSPETWQARLCGNTAVAEGQPDLVLAPGTKHSVELEADGHLTAFIRARFRRPQRGGATLQVTYSESYEDEPHATPWARNKGDRCDYTKGLYGPKDIYAFRGKENVQHLGYYANESKYETFMPFHFRTFRFLRLDIDAGQDGLAFDGLEVHSTHYPLDVSASFEADQPGSENNKLWKQLWSTSVRTLLNCMHDCYEDCPLYEQLQYAMDTRSSALFTYNLSGDDRLARQALMQLHNSFEARIGLTASRAPSHRPQLIPHFSLYWIIAVCDHYFHSGDVGFSSRFLSVIDAVLSYFETRVGSSGLVHSDTAEVWQYVDWAREWSPFGVPPAVERTNISTYTNQLYAYTLSIAAGLLKELGRPGMAEEYLSRSEKIVQRVREICHDGEFFTDTVSSDATKNDYSQHCQIWAVLSGCVTGTDAQELLRKSLHRSAAGNLVQESIAMSFYTLRALSVAGGTVYNDAFPSFWTVWKKQLDENLTTWVEDQVGQRSDCHAWGSIPIYEAMVEVAGVHLARPGWKAVTFSPRINLFPELEAVVPLNMVDGTPRGLIRVAWRRNEEGGTHLWLTIEMRVPEEISVNVLIPGHEQVLHGMGGQWDFDIEAP